METIGGQLLIPVSCHMVSKGSKTVKHIHTLVCCFCGITKETEPINTSFFFSEAVSRNAVSYLYLVKKVGYILC